MAGGGGGASTTITNHQPPRHHQTNPFLTFSKPTTPFLNYNSRKRRILVVLSSSRRSRRSRIVVAAAAAASSSSSSDTETVRERKALKDLFQDAYERCRASPMDGVSFSIDHFHSSIDKYDFNSEIGTKVKGMIFNVDNNGAYVDITAKSAAFLPVREASILDIKHVGEVGMQQGMQVECEIIGENQADDSMILSLRKMQFDLAWERCRQLQAEDVVLKGKIVGANKGGLVAVVEGLRGFIPFSQISSKSVAEELIEKELPLKFIQVDEELNKLVLSNRKAIADSQAQLGIGSVVVGTVQSLKPFGAFIDIGGMNGLLHVSQISHDRVSDIATVLQPGDTLKVMILSHDREKGRVSLSTKKLEPTPGDMVRNPKLVFEKADEMAQTFRQRIAQAEAMARSDMLRFQPEESGLTLNSDGILGPLGASLPLEGLDLSEIPPAFDELL